MTNCQKTVVFSYFLIKLIIFVLAYTWPGSRQESWHYCWSPGEVDRRGSTTSIQQPPWKWLSVLEEETQIQIQSKHVISINNWQNILFITTRTFALITKNTLKCVLYPWVLSKELKDAGHSLQSVTDDEDEDNKKTNPETILTTTSS